MSSFTANSGMNKVTTMNGGMEARKFSPCISQVTHFLGRSTNSSKTRVCVGLDNSVGIKFNDTEGTNRPKDICERENVNLFDIPNTNKVIFIMGATGSGKTRLSIDLATHIPAEIINSDKIQVYEGLDIAGNKVPEIERKGVPHHLLGEIEPEIDFDALDFCRHALSAVEKIVRSEKVPIIVGGSNSFLQALVEDPVFKFKSRYESFFIWLDVSLPVLYSRVSERVNEMVDAGLVDEVRAIFKPDADYNKGVRRAIGVPEFHEYFLAEAEADNKQREILLASAIDEMKINTQKLVSRQVANIKRLRDELGWPVHRIDATTVVSKNGEEANLAWNQVVLQPCIEMLKQFL